MEGRTFNYGTITLKDIENNSHLTFECNGNYKQVIVSKEEKENGE